MSSRTREDIAAAALALVDAEGLEALTMRRLAAELGIGAMTLYHYVTSKQELVHLLQEAVMLEMLVPEDEFPTDWREAVAAISRRTRDLFVAHPWVLVAGMRGDEDDADRAAFNPHVEQSLRAVAGLDIGPETKYRILFAADDYVFGYVVRTQTGWNEEDEPGGDRFEQGLTWLLDGIAADLEARR